MRRKMSVLGMVMLMTLSAFVLVGSALAADKLVVADMHPAGSVVAQGVEWWGKEVEKRTDKKVTFDYYWGASLVAPGEQTVSLIKNVIQVGELSSYNPDISPFPQLIAFPMILTGSVENAVKASDTLFRTDPEILKWLKENNLKYLFMAINAHCYIWSKVPIKKTSDFEKLPVRTFGGFLSLFEALGANLVSIPLPEIYAALERGVAKTTTQYLSNGVAFKFPEVTKYLIKTNLGHLPLPIVINKSAWDKLPADVKKIVDDISEKEMIAKYTELDKISTTRELGIVEKSRMEVSELPAAEVDMLKKLSKEKVWAPYTMKLENRGIAGQKVLDHYLELIRKY